MSDSKTLDRLGVLLLAASDKIHEIKRRTDDRLTKDHRDLPENDVAPFGVDAGYNAFENENGYPLNTQRDELPMSIGHGYGNGHGRFAVNPIGEELQTQTKHVPHWISKPFNTDEVPPFSLLGWA